MQRTAILAATLIGLVSACGQSKSVDAGATAPLSQAVETNPQPVFDLKKNDVVAEVVEVVDEVEQPSLFDIEALVPALDDDTDYAKRTKTLVEAGRFGEAATAARNALAADPSADAWRVLGETYLQAGETERGVACLEKAVSMDRYLFDTEMLLAKHYLDAGDFVAARKHVEHVAINRIDDVDANYLAGRIYGRLSMWQEAIDAYARVVEVEPAHKFARNNLGFAALQVGRPELALVHLEETLDLDPLPYMLNNLGIAYERNEQDIDALAAFLRAEQMRPGYVNARVNIARVKADLSDDELQLALDIVEELKAPTKAVDTVAAMGASDAGDVSAPQ